MKVISYLRILAAILLLVSAPDAVSAADFTLKGKVVDEDGNGLELASVMCLEQGKLAMTNLKGEFNISLQSSDSVTVKFSMVGYKARTRKFIRPRGTLTVQIIMYQQEALDEVTITERRRQTTGTEQLDIKDLKSSPSVTGNAVEELIQQQAGVSTHNELSSQYNVRGGSFDENVVYINNVEVYRPPVGLSG